MAKAGIRFISRNNLFMRLDRCCSAEPEQVHVPKRTVETVLERPRELLETLGMSLCDAPDPCVRHIGPPNVDEILSQRTDENVDRQRMLAPVHIGFARRHRFGVSMLLSAFRRFDVGANDALT